VHASSKKCPYCRASSRFSFAYDGQAFFDCRGCDLVFRDDHPHGGESMIRYYEERYFEELTGDQLLGQRDRLFSHVLDEIEEAAPPGTLLDAGCGCGHFLKNAQDRGWLIKGVDPSGGSIAYSRALVKDATLKGTLKDLQDGQTYDVITMINVLDHTVEPWQETLQALSLLKPGGLLYLRFPNGRYHQALWKTLPRLVPLHWVMPYVVFHQHSFRSRFMERLLSRQGYVDIVIRNAAISDRLRPCFFLGERINEGLRSFLNATLKRTNRLFGPSVLWGPSLTVMARKKRFEEAA
jgi:2-polyprenyl-3-methyl-5-hydroxy-6-metoxy-1,4-benzoquinol methylase